MQRISLLILIFVLTVTPLMAEEKETIKIGEVVVTATRTEEEVEKISANVTVITEEDIKKSTATTVQDILRNEEGLIIRDFYGTGTKSTVDMRGFGRGLNTVILIDGRRVNEIDLSGVDWNLIPLENVERIEIVRGSGSVLYGDNAMVGVINIITKKGKTKKPEFEIGAKVGSYDENDEYFTVRGVTNRMSYFLFGKNRETDGYRDNSEFDAKNINARVTADLTDKIFIDFSGGYHEDHQGYPGGLTESQLGADRRQSLTPDDGADYDQYYFDLKVDFAMGKWGDIEVGYSFNNREFNTDFASAGGTITRDTDTDSFKLKLATENNILNHRNLLIAGIDLNRSKADSSSSFPGFSSSTDVRKREAGYYIQDEFSLSEKFLISLGYRFSNAKFKDNVSGVSFGFPLSGYSVQKFEEDAVRAGLTYNYADGSKVFTSYSKGYRLPTTDELFSFDGTIIRLRPERADTYEIGIVHAFNHKTETRLTLYTMDVEDELYWNPTGGPFGFGANENLNETRHQGTEFGFSAGLTDSVLLFGNYTYTKATFESGLNQGKTIPLIPRQSANLGTNVKLTENTLLTLKGNWVGDKYLDNDIENVQDKLSDYLTIDAKLSYQYKVVTAYVGVNNIFDKEYSEYGVLSFTGVKNFYPAPERQYYGGVKIVF